jgi:hypothetical protein
MRMSLKTTKEITSDGHAFPKRLVMWFVRG